MGHGAVRSLHSRRADEERTFTRTAKVACALLTPTRSTKDSDLNIAPKIFDASRWANCRGTAWMCGRNTPISAWKGPYHQCGRRLQNTATREVWFTPDAP